MSASIAIEKKAIGTSILDVKKTSTLSDYIVICSGSSDRQVRAITDSVLKKLKDFGKKPLNVEGYSEGKWVLVDFNDIIMHVFYEPLRSYYRLEELWPEAEEIIIPIDYMDKVKSLTGKRVSDD